MKDWCKLIGYGCPKANDGNGAQLPPDTVERRRQECDNHFVAAATFCTEVIGKNMKEKDLELCFDNAIEVHSDCIEAATGTRPSLISNTN